MKGGENMFNPFVMALAETPALPGGGGSNMWETITSGVNSFITGVVTPVMTLCTTSEICLAFLACTFVGIGVRNVRRLVGAFGRGR